MSETSDLIERLNRLAYQIGIYASDIWAAMLSASPAGRE